MAEDGEWVVVWRPREKSLWKPTSVNGDNDDEDEDRPLKVVFSGPATHWSDAIAIVNGRIGALIWGGVAADTIQLNGRSVFCIFSFWY